MAIVDPDSLAGTLDAVNEALFFGWPLTKTQRTEAAQWIAGRQGGPRAYTGMFAPTEADFGQGMRVFTGERIRSGAGTAHVLGEEACRALRLLEVPLAGVRAALERATAGMQERLEKSGFGESGRYCCGSCSVAVWRHLAAGGFGGREDWLQAALGHLRSRRDEAGKWRSVPFWYTLLAVSDTDLPAALDELRYAAPVCERHLSRRSNDGQFAARRRALAERVLTRC